MQLYGASQASMHHIKPIEHIYIQGLGRGAEVMSSKLYLRKGEHITGDDSDSVAKSPTSVI